MEKNTHIIAKLKLFHMNWSVWSNFSSSSVPLFVDTARQRLPAVCCWPQSALLSTAALHTGYKY